MLRIITEENKVLDIQNTLVNLLKERLIDEGDFKIGFPSGSVSARISFDKNIWYYSHNITNSSPRFWNGFGIASELSDKKNNNIVVEINIPTHGINKRVSGFFATDESNNVFLMHRGKVGGGRKGIGKNAFLNWHQGRLEPVFHNEEENKALIIGDINSNEFINELTKFIKDVSKFKALTTSGLINEATFLSSEELTEKVKDISEKHKPQKNNILTSVFERNPYIAEYSKRRANGKCELCKQNAPFKDKIGRPYLENHHIIWLSRQGEDSIENTVALCPNCHRKMHILDSKVDKEALKNLQKF